MAREGHAKDGLALMRQSSTERLALGVTWYQILYMCMLAESYLQHERTDEGLAAIAEAKELVARADEHIWEAELNRIDGELQRLQGASPDKLECLFQKALAIARNQSAKSFELRASMSLARFWRDQQL